MHDNPSMTKIKLYIIIKLILETLNNNHQTTKFIFLLSDEKSYLIIKLLKLTRAKYLFNTQ